MELGLQIYKHQGNFCIQDIKLSNNKLPLNKNIYLNLAEEIFKRNIYDSKVNDGNSSILKLEEKYQLINAIIKYNIIDEAIWLL